VYNSDVIDNVLQLQVRCEREKGHEEAVDMGIMGMMMMTIAIGDVDVALEPEEGGYYLSVSLI